MSRAALEPRFRSILGRTLHQEVQRVRIERAKSLLAETDLPIKQIALQSGFKNVQYLTRVFSATVGQSPAAFREYRRHNQSRPETTCRQVTQDKTSCVTKANPEEAWRELTLG